MFTKLLAATETPVYCDECVATAFRIAERHDAKVLVLHVLESDTPLYRNYVRHFRTGEEIIASSAYIAEVTQELERQCAAAVQPPTDFRIKVRTGLPWEEILRTARNENVDLILMNPRARNADKKRIGSTVGGVIRRERCPVTIVNQFPSSEQLEFQKLMVCIDFSPSCEQALDFAVKLAQVYESKIDAFHVMTNHPDQTAAHRTRERLESLCADIPNRIPQEVILVKGSQPHLEILRAARDHAIDMLVMGSHTKPAGTKWYLGGVVERVSSRSPCPVTVVTDPKAIKRWAGIQ